MRLDFDEPFADLPNKCRRLFPLAADARYILLNQRDYLFPDRKEIVRDADGMDLSFYFDQFFERILVQIQL